ncbi:hypothetical protein Taro_054567, partial [Colocasia esculenta]|nr:hypothetical protein [Colocasia esculenta]
MDLQLCVCSCLTCSRGAAVGPFVRDCETERLFLCCVVRLKFNHCEHEMVWLLALPMRPSGVEVSV